MHIMTNLSSSLGSLGGAMLSCSVGVVWLMMSVDELVFGGTAEMEGLTREKMEVGRRMEAGLSRFPKCEGE